MMQWLGHVQTITQLLFIVVPSALLLYVLGKGFYNLFLHPLRSYPGPLLGAPRSCHTTGILSTVHCTPG